MAPYGKLTFVEHFILRRPSTDGKDTKSQVLRRALQEIATGAVMEGNPMDEFFKIAMALVAQEFLEQALTTSWEGDTTNEAKMARTVIAMAMSRGV